MKQAVSGVCPRGDGHLRQGVLTVRYKGCCSTKLALPALGLCVLVRRGIHHSVPKTRHAHSELAMGLAASGMTCMFC